MADYAADAEALLGVVGWERCRVMGVSFGGMVAQEFAVTYPQRVERLVLACTSSGGAGGASFPLHTLMEGSAEEQARIMLGLADTRRDAAWQAQHPDQAQELINLSLHAEQPGATEPGRQDGLRRQLAARAGHDVFDRLPRLTMPVFVCGGRYDGLAPPANLAAIQGQIAGSQLALFEGGHGFLQEDPAAYAAVIDFLQAP